MKDNVTATKTNERLHRVARASVTIGAALLLVTMTTACASADGKDDPSAETSQDSLSATSPTMTATDVTASGCLTGDTPKYSTVTFYPGRYADAGLFVEVTCHNATAILETIGSFELHYAVSLGNGADGVTWDGDHYTIQRGPLGPGCSGAWASGDGDCDIRAETYNNGHFKTIVSTTVHVTAP